LFTHQCILYIRHAARPCAGYRAVIEAAARATDQHLWRGTYEGRRTHAQIEHIWRRVDHSERSIDLEWMGDYIEFEALREHHLKYVAGFYIRFGILDVF